MDEPELNDSEREVVESAGARVARMRRQFDELDQARLSRPLIPKSDEEI